jgi:CSLREA domain-containing protein
MDTSALESLARRTALALALAASATAHATTILVDDAGDTPTPGKCTLREAITAASMNTASGGCAAGQAGPTVDVIHFAIPGASLHTITLGSTLPDITDIVTIDGYTQAGSSENTLQVGDDAKLMIEVSGAGLCSCVPMLRIAASGSRVRGLVIDHTSSSGIYIQAISGTTSDVVVEGNFIGVDATGMNVAASTNQAPVKISATPIGWAARPRPSATSSAAAATTLSGSAGPATSFRATTSASAPTALKGCTRTPTGLPRPAIDLSTGGATNGTLIGGSVAGAGNVLFGTNAAIHLGSLAQNAVIKGNYIGTDATGTVGLGAIYGIYTDNHPAGTIIGGAAGWRRQSSSRETASAFCSATAPQGRSSRATGSAPMPGGTKPVPNYGDGIHVTHASNFSIIGGTAPGEGNTIAYNCSNGIAIAASTGWAMLGIRSTRTSVSESRCKTSTACLSRMTWVTVMPAPTICRISRRSPRRRSRPASSTSPER